MERHESTLQKLLDFIGPKGNVHKDIKIMAAQLSSSLKEIKRLQSAEKKLTQEKRMEASTRGTQTMLTNSRVVIQNVAQDNAEQMENLKTPNSKRVAKGKRKKRDSMEAKDMKRRKGQENLSGNQEAAVAGNRPEPE